MPGYSATPLVKKLGIKDGSIVALRSAPDDYEHWLAPLPADARFVAKVDSKANIIHVFATERVRLARELDACRKKMAPDAAVWVSWPKKSARVATDITEDLIRDIALPLGLVDVKVCAVTDVWAGLKLVIRKALR